MQIEAPEDQAALWNGSAGQAWVDGQDLLDRLFAPFEQLLVEGALAQVADDVLDIGCGTGSTTVAVARALAAARCTGLDISAPMIEAARARAGWEALPVDFVVGDAETHGFEARRFDRIVSRFGVMFFADPVAAFANLRGSARDGAALDLIVWRSAEDNPFMITAERAAAPLLPCLPARKAGGPGQFGFADPDRVRTILGEGGWGDVAVRPLDIPCVMPEAELVRYFTRLGPVGRLLGQVDAPARERIVETVRAAFDPYVQQDEVRFAAACWRIGGRAG
ncbi:class I SAM-dependent methyltransferase [Sphingomonas psychrotolerans]|uniref:SAM-dependent methyltransferase n=1 Tax=Sphingomonas psychrotolerans TaxID=1327635 RepID=A0A2K8ME21_9SPHN|nr:class I SAM-dependent methyltransferase [Sphingomonas psychrotolerans]ATY32135.1 SAM-dependent methyltransferase [Sphingomonas psychrotolerans]